VVRGLVVTVNPDVIPQNANLFVLNVHLFVRVAQIVGPASNMVICVAHVVSLPVMTAG
jgi:hypothetical protein